MVTQIPDNSFPRLVRVATAIMLMLVSMMASATAAEVEARLDHESVSAGSGVLLTISIAGGRSQAPAIPEVADLIIESRGESQQMRMFDGQTTVTTTYRYIVGSNTPGDYRIPALEVTVDGSKQFTQPLKLKVLAAAAAQPPAGMPPNPAGSRPATTEEADTGGRRFGFLTVELADNQRKYVYVGEIAPVRIRAWLPIDSRAQLRSGIQPEGKAFTLHNVSDQPQQTHETRDGKNYLVVTWFGGMSAAKAGKYPASLSVDATVAVRDNAALKPPRRRMGSLFDDPFFDRFLEDMSVPMVQKDVTLKSDDQEIEVRPLPVTGRPAGFSGAVGDFKLGEYDLPAKWQTGEPQQIRASVSGSGNFALLKAPDLTPAEGWRTYPGKDDFTAGDVASFSGSKSFQFSAVPRKGGAQELALEFSFFDPAAGAYKTVSGPTKIIQVSGRDLAEDQPAVAAAGPTPAGNDGGLVAQNLELGRAGSLLPLVARPTFVIILGVSGGLCLLGPLLAWLRIRRSDSRRNARTAMEKATREALLVADRCAATSDVPGFFAAARLALQVRLAGVWNQPAQAITLAEISTRIPDDSPIARFFIEADRHQYSRQSGGDVQPQWRALLAEAMACPTPSAD